MDEVPSFELLQDPRDVLAATAAEAGEVRLRHVGDDDAIIREIVEVLRHQLQQPLRDPPFQVEEEEVLRERLLDLNLSRGPAAGKRFPKFFYC